MEEELRAMLLARDGISGIVGNRLNFGAHPQGQPLPAIVLNTISDAPGYTMQGSDGLYDGRVQVDCYAMSYGQAKQLSRAVRTALSGYAGGGFQGVFLAGSRDTREGEGDRPFRVSLDFLTQWSDDNG